MGMNWDWSPVAGAFQGLMQQQQQQQQYKQLLQGLLGPDGVPQSPAQLLMQPNPPQPSADATKGANVVPGIPQGGGMSLPSFTYSQPSMQATGPSIPLTDAQRQQFRTDPNAFLNPQQPQAAATPQPPAPLPQQPQSPLSGMSPELRQLFSRLPPQIGLPLLMQVVGDKLIPKAHTFSSTRDGQVYDTSTGQMIGTSVKDRDAAAANAANQAEANTVAGTDATGNIGSLDSLPLESGNREALRSLVQSGGAKGLDTYRDVMKSQADQKNGGITTRNVDVGDQTKVGQFKDGQLIGFAKGPDGKEITAPRFKPDAAPPGADPADLTTDPDSGSILRQTGLTLPAYMALTGKASQLPRDAATRTRAFREAENFANKRGVDVSTLTSQFQAYNETLNKNIQRVNQTKIMEGELAGTIDNLKPVADAAGQGRLRLANVAKIWAGQETNDPITEQYAFQLNQLRSELAAYNGALQGRSGASLTQQDYAEAERVIKNGLSAKGADGLRTAVGQATEKMSGVLARNVDSARKSVWDLFGVGQNYKPQTPAASTAAPTGVPTATGPNGQKLYLRNGQWVPQ